MPRAWINPQRLILTGCMFILLFNAGGIANDVVFLLGLIEYFLYSNPLQIPRHAQQLQHGRRTQPWHRPPGARQRQLPLPLLLEGDHRERTVGGTHAPGSHQPYYCEEKVLEGPRRLEFLANPAHGPIQNQTIPRALPTEREVKSYGPTQGLGIQKREQIRKFTTDPTKTSASSQGHEFMPCSLLSTGTLNHHKHVKMGI
ncbi:hypothetical protein WN943_018616 [Citrus x changshan-huyou]